jgi:hypothetical protein
MTKMRHFVVVLARTGKSMKEVKILTDQAYGNISLKKKQMYKNFNEVKQGKNTGDESVSNPLKNQAHQEHCRRCRRRHLRGPRPSCPRKQFSPW